MFTSACEKCLISKRLQEICFNTFGKPTIKTKLEKSTCSFLVTAKSLQYNAIHGLKIRGEREKKERERESEKQREMQGGIKYICLIIHQ